MPALKEAADTHDAVAAIIAEMAERELTLSEAATIALLAVEGIFLGFVEHKYVLLHARDIVAGVLAGR